MTSLTKSAVRQIVFGDKVFSKIRYRLRTKDDEPWNSENFTSIKLMKKQFNIT
jgi:hypothetical protein